MHHDFYQHPHFQAIMANAIECPGDIAPLLVARDWLLDHGETEERAKEVFRPPLLVTDLAFDSFASGNGAGYGAEDGEGTFTVFARGLGSGYVSAGLGYLGYGGGAGCVWGNGEGVDPYAEFDLRHIMKRGYKDIQMQVGKAYIIGTSDWFVWVGRAKRQVGPWEWELTACSKISSTNNPHDPDSWQNLADDVGDARRRATYVHYPDGTDDVLDAEGNVIELGVDGVILSLGILWKCGWRGMTPLEALRAEKNQ